MNDVKSVRRGGVLAVTAGNLLVAASVVVMLALGPRALGQTAFVGFALAWTSTTVFGYGLAMPTEQLISRRLSAADGSLARVAARRLLLLAAMASAGAAGWAVWSPASAAYAPMLPAMLAGIWGWVLVAVCRGALAGRGDLRSYGWILGLEATFRALLVVAAWLASEEASVLLACAIGVPVLLAGVAGAALSRRTPPLQQGEPVNRADLAAGASPRIVAWKERREQLSFVLIAAGFQVCMNGAPIVLEWRVGAGPEATAIGAFVVANSYYRLASVLTGGFATPALVRLSATRARGDDFAFGGHLHRALLGVTATTGLATFAAVVAAPAVLPILYGQRLLLAPIVSAALAVSTVAAAMAAVAGTALMATGDAGTAARWWATGAAILLLIVALDDHISGATAFGLITGPAVALIGVLLSTRARRRRSIFTDP